MKSPSPIQVFFCFEPDQQICADRIESWPRVNTAIAEYNARIDLSPDAPEAVPIKNAIQAQIAAADVFVCIIAGGSFASPWIDWEVRAAAEARKGLVGILLKDFYEIPAAMQNRGAMFTPFTRDKVEAAVQWAFENQPGSEDYTLQED